MDTSLERPRLRTERAFPLQALRIASSREVVQPALRTALFVGTLLNLINQGDALIGPAQLAIGKLLFTYCVPYCVSSYTATRLLLRAAAARATGQR
ncbi:MAG: nitrate/nitrite transporter NrtS [Myxococcales bacterium]